MFGILPSSFVLGDTFDGQEAMPFARGGFACVYQAVFKGRHVAVKTLFATNGTEGLRRTHRVRGSIQCRTDYSLRDISCLPERLLVGSGFGMKTFYPS